MCSWFSFVAPKITEVINGLLKQKDKAIWQGSREYFFANPKYSSAAKLVIFDLEVRLGDEVRSAPTLCAKYKGKIIPLNTAHDGRPILMKEENSIEN